MNVIVGNKIEVFHMKTQMKALELEIKGMKSRRGSIYAFIKSNYGLKGNKQKVLEQFKNLINSKEQQLQFPFMEE